MKKKLSLMPKEGKKKQEIKKMQKVGIVLVTIPALVAVYNYGFNLIKTEELERMKENQRQADITKSEISTEETTREVNQSMLNNLKNNGFPLNKFMLFVGTQIPSDIRIYEITRGEVTPPKKEQEVNIQVETNLPNYQENTEGQGEFNQEMSLSEEINGGMAEELNMNEQTNTEMEQVGKEQSIVRDNKVVVKGAGLKVDSIARFVEELKNNSEYVEKIELSDVRNYNNGQFNYKMFEMIIHLR